MILNTSNVSETTDGVPSSRRFTIPYMGAVSVPITLPSPAPVASIVSADDNKWDVDDSVSSDKEEGLDVKKPVVDARTRAFNQVLGLLKEEIDANIDDDQRLLLEHVECRVKELFLNKRERSPNGQAKDKKIYMMKYYVGVRADCSRVQLIVRNPNRMKVAKIDPSIVSVVGPFRQAKSMDFAVENGILPEHRVVF